MLVALSEKVWGKFYASPAAIDQYEETTASLVVFQRLSKKVIWKPKVYWRRNQDEYVFIRRTVTGICIFQTRLLQN
jgi:iron complex outermembrane receptor protein